jgi:hypothetical protein
MADRDGAQRIGVATEQQHWDCDIAETMGEILSFIDKLPRQIARLRKHERTPVAGSYVQLI